jgi:hypothetical protein
MLRCRVRSFAWLGVLAIAVLGSPLAADDGRIEIDIDCVLSACFTGDSGGGNFFTAFPVTIGAAGSYVLTSNLDAAAMMGTMAIEITASNVSLDLNGFFMSAVSSSTAGTLHISGSNVEVKNGMVQGNGGAAITATGGQIRLKNLRVIATGAQGIDFQGMGSDNEVIDSIVTSGTFGISSPTDRSRVIGCHVSGGSTDGIRVGSKSIVADNIVTNLNGAGTMSPDGIEAGPSSVVSGNIVQVVLSGDGIDVGANSVVRDNVVHGNGGVGINLDTATLVIGNTVVGNAGGNIDPACGVGCTLVDNHAP